MSRDNCYGKAFLSQWNELNTSREAEKAKSIATRDLDQGINWDGRNPSDSKCDEDHFPSAMMSHRNLTKRDGLRENKAEEWHTKTLQDSTRIFVDASKQRRLHMNSTFPLSGVVYPSEGIMDHSFLRFPSHGPYARAATTLPNGAGGAVHPIFSTPLRCYQRDVQPRLGPMAQAYLTGEIEAIEPNKTSEEIYDIDAEIHRVQSKIALKRLERTVNGTCKPPNL